MVNVRGTTNVTKKCQKEKDKKNNDECPRDTGALLCNSLKDVKSQHIEGFNFVLGIKGHHNIKSLTSHHGVTLVRRQIPSNGGAGC